MYVYTNTLKRRASSTLKNGLLLTILLTLYMECLTDLLAPIQNFENFGYVRNKECLTDLPHFCD